MDLSISIRPQIVGTFTRADLDKLTAPIAWQGTVSQERRNAEEQALLDLASEARAALDESPDAAAVEIEGGKVVATIAA